MKNSAEKPNITMKDGVALYLDLYSIAENKE